MKINENYKNVAQSYLFSTIAKKVAEYTEAHPEKKIIRMGIGDVTLPLCNAVIEALHGGVEDMGKKESFHGYGPEQGYGFVKQPIQQYYAGHGVELAEEEIFISDGAKSDVGNLSLIHILNQRWIMSWSSFPNGRLINSSMRSGRWALR